MTKHTTGIEWTHRPGTKGETWNPIVGCSIVSPGCTNCYAMRMAERIQRMTPGSHYEGTTKLVNGNPVWTGKVALAPERTLLAPMKAKAPRTYFVNSMGDLFHEDVPDEWLEQVFAVMAMCPQHTFIILTKRANRMRNYVIRDIVGLSLAIAIELVGNIAKTSADRRMIKEWPLPNVWLGVSAERQQEADDRIPDLLATSAAVRFVSAEPLLGRIDFTAVQRRHSAGFARPLDGRFNRVDWIIVGGESGPGARPMKVEWAEDIVAQCREAGVAVFVKQLGAHPVHIDGETPYHTIRHNKGADVSEWPEELRVQEWPTVHAEKEPA